MTDTTKALDLDALQRLCDAATPGPWVPRTKYPHIVVQPDDGMVSTNLANSPGGDAAFIAAARTAVPELIAEVQRLRAETEAHEGELGDMRASLSAAEAALDDAQDRDVAKERIHPVLHDLDVRIPNLAVEGCHCNLIAEVVLDALFGSAKEADRG